MSQGLLCPAASGSPGPGHEAEEGGRESLVMMAQTPYPQPDLQLQGWCSSGVCLETGLLQASTLHPTHPTP